MASWKAWGEQSTFISPSIRANSRTPHPSLSCGFLSRSKALKPQSNSSVFGALQNLKEDKTKPVRDEYEYVSDEGELKIDEFPIRRKKNTVKRDLSCELFNLNDVVYPKTLKYGLKCVHMLSWATCCHHYQVIFLLVVPVPLCYLAS